MITITLCLALLPAWSACTGEGNIRLLKEEVAVALKACVNPNEGFKEGSRQRRSDTNDVASRIDGGMKQVNTNSHARRNFNDTSQIQVLNVTEYDYDGIGSGNTGENVAEDKAGMSADNLNRTRRGEPVFNKPDDEQCLSQCVFANLQVVDSRGIPREAELWNKVQTSVTSQQSRAALRDQIRACFQELQSEAEDDGCSYSNKLERCLMLRFSDRNTDAIKNSQNQAADSKSTASHQD